MTTDGLTKTLEELFAEVHQLFGRFSDADSVWMIALMRFLSLSRPMSKNPEYRTWADASTRTGGAEEGDGNPRLVIL